MAVPSLDSLGEAEAERHPLIMAQSLDHVIDITSVGFTSSSTSRGDGPCNSDGLHHQDRSSASAQTLGPQSSLSLPTLQNTRNVPAMRRNDNYGRRRRSPMNSGFWISVELIASLSQITAAIIILLLSRHEHPRSPLFEWIIGYAAGLAATLPHLYWRYIYHNSRGGPRQNASQLRWNSSQNNSTESHADDAVNATQGLGAEQHWNLASLCFGRNLVASNPRLNSFMDHFKMALDCCFAVWFVVGNVWVFGGHSSAADAPNLYRLCIVFLAFSCIGYALPFILCATICCCLPCIISFLGIREDMPHNRGATADVINALPCYKFKYKRGQNGDDSEISSENMDEVGILAAGTDKERLISSEDTVCSICLTKFTDGIELRELPCSHFFHMECIDKWLKLNALCPLCKSEVGGSTAAFSSANSTSHQNEQRVGSSADPL
ncbi:Anaphase-promoting complex (APC) subunit 11 protein [Dioscorea alata]|nr:Anaphase-promoting complex (APC) subunit 11 protein [Dioscorea alata]